MNPYLDPLGPLLERFYEIAFWSSAKATAAYAKAHGLEQELIGAHAGGLVIVGCQFTGNGFFQLDEDGEPGVVIEALAEDGATVLDLVAWPLDRPEAFATALNNADALGIGNAFNPATWFGRKVLQMHRTPLGWLQGGCSGCCILDHRFVPIWLRKALGPIEVEDLEHAREFDAMLNLPRFPRSHILVPPTVSRRAA